MSSLAYNLSDIVSYNNGFSPNFCLTLQENLININLLRPNLTFYLDIKPETAIERIDAWRDTKDIFENETFLRNVREKYKWLLNRRGSLHNIFGKVIYINGELDIEIISEEVWNCIRFILFGYGNDT
jgi:thymidylate kinase